MREGTEVEIEVADGRLLVASVDSLASLVAGITPENLPERVFEDGVRGAESW